MAEKNTILLDFTNDLLNMRRAYYESAWYSNLHAYENNHFIGWNSQTNSITKFPTKKKFFIQFPEVKKQVDGFQNLLLASNPVYQVYPTDYTDKKQKDDARHQSLFLKQHFLDWHEDNILHTMIHNAGVLPFSFLETAIENIFDIESGKRIWTTVPRIFDAFDYLFDPRYHFDQQPCIVKLVRTTNDKVAQSKLYKDFKGQNITSFPQDYKEIYYTDKFGSTAVRYTNRLILAECQEKVGDDIVFTTIDGAGQILRKNTVKEMPFWNVTMFQPSSGNPYQPSILENLLPMNRSLDLVANRIESMTMKYVKGSYLMPANTSVTMSDEDGTLLTYKGAVAPTVLQHPNMPEWAWQFIQFMQGSSDRYGISSQVLGAPPKGSNIRSGKMMDKTSASTLAQQKLYIDAFSYVLKRAAQNMIYLESKLLKEPRKFTMQTPEAINEDYVTKQFVGEDYYEQYKGDENIVPLPKSFKKLTITIEDESTHGQEAKRNGFERMIKLYPDVKEKSPELQAQFLSVFLETGDIATIMSEGEKSNTMLTSSFKNIVENVRNMGDANPDLKNAIGVIAEALSKDPALEKPANPDALKGQPPKQGEQPGQPQPQEQPQEQPKPEGK